MEGDKDVEEIKLTKLILVHDAKLEAVSQKISDLSAKIDWYKTQLQEKDAFVRKLIYLIISVLGTLAGAGGLVKAILGI